MKSQHAMPFGAALLPGGGARFRLWAPGSARVELALGDAAALRQTINPIGGGWHEATRADAGAGTRYRYIVDGGLAVPDPASRFNPDDVGGASEVVDALAYDWRDAGWRGRPWHEAVIYELHVGTFTAEGSFEAAARELPALAQLGITAIELMPLADFAGRRGWGYDGVLPFAPDSAYGTPEQLKGLIDAAHALGLMVLLDVVYNHFGPEGNYLHAYCPPFFNEHQQTPWGAAINFDGEDSRTVRDFFVANALYWTEEYHVDGLRLDAVHAIRDRSAEPIVCEIGRALREGPGRERHVHLVLENGDNRAQWLARDAHGVPRCASAQWNDDFHHAAQVLLTGETDGYYADYGPSRAAALDNFGRALAEGFVFQGQPSPFHGGAARGEPSAQLPPLAFVAFLQNHDQIGNRAFGNRAFGERLSESADPLKETPGRSQVSLTPSGGGLGLPSPGGAQQLDAAYACLLLAPQVPLLFMGEEWAATTPFLYFCDFHAELARAVTEGRRAEFARFAAFADPAARARIPDPNDAATFAASRLQRGEAAQPPHRERRAWIAALLALRHRHLVPRLPLIRHGGRHTIDGMLLEVAWPLADGSRWRLLANFGDQEVTLPAAASVRAPPPAAAPTTTRAPAPAPIPAPAPLLEPTPGLVSSGIILSHRVQSQNRMLRLAPNAVQVSIEDGGGG